MKRPSKADETRSANIDTEMELTPAQLEQSVGGAERTGNASGGITANDDWEAPVV